MKGKVVVGNLNVMNDAVVNFLSTISTMVQDEKAEGEGGQKRGALILKSGGRCCRYDGVRMLIEVFLELQHIIIRLT